MKPVALSAAPGFFGSHLAARLKPERYWVGAVDLKYSERSDIAADFVLGDLLGFEVKRGVAHRRFDEVDQRAADSCGVRSQRQR